MSCPCVAFAVCLPKPIQPSVSGPLPILHRTKNSASTSAHVDLRIRTATRPVWACFESDLQARHTCEAIAALECKPRTWSFFFSPSYSAHLWTTWLKPCSVRSFFAPKATRPRALPSHEQARARRSSHDLGCNGSNVGKWVGLGNGRTKMTKTCGPLLV